MKKTTAELSKKIASDEEIVELYWQRNERAIKETDIKYKNMLMSIAYRIIRDELDCEECLNDTYLGAWNSMPPTRPSVLPAFLSTIMRRCAVNRYNAAVRKKRIPSEMTESLSELEGCITDTPAPEDDTAAVELGVVINSFVRSLEKRQRYIFIGRYYFAESIDTIASELGISRSMVNKEIAAIKEALKKKLESEGYVL